MLRGYQRALNWTARLTKSNRAISYYPALKRTVLFKMVPIREGGSEMIQYCIVEAWLTGLREGGEG
jgi:hypothetical protein